MTLVGVLIGSGLTILTEKIRSDATRSREQEARTDARRDLIFQRRNQFQRETLLDLQEVSLRVMRNAAEHHHFDLDCIRTYGKRFVKPYPEKMEEEALVVNGRSAILGTRVRDEEVRRLLKKMKNEAISAFPEADGSVRDAYIDAAGRTLVKLNERIGVVLNELDDEVLGNPDSP